VTLTVYDPTGGIDVTQTFSPRLSDLNGKTICEVSNGMWEASRTFPLIAQLLQKQFPTATIISYDKFPTAATAVNQKLVDAVKKAGCQGVIVGNAG
jgi:ABC-type amino acid transport substrate-binding protein